MSEQPLPPARPAVARLGGPFPVGALTVDVEEWYHTCMVPDYVDPARRPGGLARQLDGLLPELLAMLDRLGCRATFFTLGEVAADLPGRVREIADAGHEVASHGYHHLRVGELSPRRFRADVERSVKLLEDLVGAPVIGYRSPEWSLRELGNPRLPLLADLGFRYDSSLAPTIGSGRRDNPLFASRLRWADGRELLELPPLTFAGRLQLPTCGWPGRLAGPRVVAAAAAEHRRRGGLPVFVVHPWELAPGDTPGELTGLARWVHELGRAALRGRFAETLGGVRWRSIREAIAGDLDEVPIDTLVEVPVGQLPAPALGHAAGGVRAAAGT